jgi:hypothetical protein
MKITWEDISTHLVYCKLTSTEPNRVYKEIYDHLKYWIPSIIHDALVTINSADSYQYDSKNKNLWIDYDNIWCVFKSKYDMVSSDIQTLIAGYVVGTHNIEVKHTVDAFDLRIFSVVGTHNIEVEHTF